jgi:diguanylate cyclase (GGDEF)-like protein
LDDGVRFYAQGEEIFREGDASDAVYVIQSGSVAIIKAEQGEKSLILARLEAPDILGEMGVLCDMPRNATARALTECRLEVIPHRDFAQWIRRDPETALRVMRTLAQRLRDADSVIAKQLEAPPEISQAELREMNRLLSRHLKKLKREQSELAEQVVRDALTGLYNRRFLDERLDRDLARARRFGFPVSLAMIDLDNFKLVNDTYGHRAGDEVLRSLGALLQSTSREGDIPCRYGGEEFVVLLPRMPLAIARQRAEQWRQAFLQQKRCYGTREFPVTMSIGLATYPEHGDNADALLDSADRALYRAKSSGRNLLVVADAEARA